MNTHCEKSSLIKAGINKLILRLFWPIPIWFACCHGFADIARIDSTKSNAMLLEHAIRADRDGLALRTDSVDESRMTISEFDQTVVNMLDKAEAWSLANTQACNTGKCPKPVVKLLIHVHGGLNCWDDTVKRMYLVEEIENDPVDQDKYYPIFISWPSGYFNAYREHLCRIRQGNRVSTKYGVASFPGVLLTDLAKGIVTMPANWVRQGVNIKDRLIYSDTIDDSKGWLSRNYKMANLNVQRVQSGELEGYDVISGTPQSGGTQVFKRYTFGILTTPIKATVGTLAQGGMTPDAWQVMKRRTRNFFYPPDLFEMRSNGNPGYENLNNYTPAGRFFDLLLARIKENTSVQYQITFVGHSMGTMVLNHLFSTRRHDWIESKSIDKIVYMGAACSVADAIQTFNPLFAGFEPDDVNAPRFYNLTLHPLAEMSEEMFPSSWPAGIVPAGSLLHLIDTHLETPNTPMDRTLGSQVNVMSTLEAFSEIKSFCNFKGFDFQTGSMPTRHGDFSKFPFWRKDFREGVQFQPLPNDVQQLLK